MIWWQVCGGRHGGGRVFWGQGGPRGSGARLSGSWYGQLQRWRGGLWSVKIIFFSPMQSILCRAKFKSININSINHISWNLLFLRTGESLWNHSDSLKVCIFDNNVLLEHGAQPHVFPLAFNLGFFMLLWTWTQVWSLWLGWDLIEFGLRLVNDIYDVHIRSRIQVFVNI